MSTQDRVTLSVKERQQLANLGASLSSADPQLARLLGAPHRGAARVGHGLTRLARTVVPVLRSKPWAGPVLSCVGAAATVVVMPYMVWLALPGLALTGAGLALSLVAGWDWWAARSSLPASGVPGDIGQERGLS